MRYLASTQAARWFGAEFPCGTLIVNLAGAFIIGLVQELGTRALLIPDTVRLFLTTAMVGGLTTVCLCLCFLGIGVGRLMLTPRE